MEPLNLTQHPPRKPGERLAGVYFMARTIDKIRATLPGGDIGEYRIEGHSARLLRELGIDEEDLRSVVALAQSEREVEQWILAHTTQGARDAVSAALSSLTIADRAQTPGWFDRYPFARELPLNTTLLEVLERDDAATFPEA